MKPYGIHRLRQNIDGRGGTKEFALKPSHENLAGRSGEVRSNFKNSAAKRAVRRRYKKAARRAALDD